MNVTKLYSLLEIIRNDFHQQDILGKLSTVINILQEYIDDASQSNSEKFKSALNIFNASMNQCKSNTLLPTQVAILENFKSFHFIGDSLRERVAETLAAYPAIQIDTYNDLSTVYHRVEEFHHAVNSVLEGFTHFGFSQDTYADNEFEIGFIYRSGSFDAGLASIKNEIQFANKLLLDISEIVGDQTSSTNIRTLSSNDITVCVAASAKTASVLMNLVAGIVKLYQTISEIQVKRSELEKMDIARDIILRLKEEENNRVNLGLESLKIDLMTAQKPSGLENGRLNELENSLSINLKLLAQKIENGLRVEVSTALSNTDIKEGIAAEIDGVDILGLTALGKLMSNSSVAYEPVLLAAKEFSKTIEKDIIIVTTEAEHPEIDKHKDILEPVLDLDITEDSMAEFDWEVIDK